LRVSGPWIQFVADEKVNGEALHFCPDSTLVKRKNVGCLEVSNVNSCWLIGLDWQPPNMREQVEALWQLG
jgi:hypothetical protein